MAESLEDQLDGPQNVYLPDSFVLEVNSSEVEVCFTIEAALELDHPLYYSPPHPGEMHAYAILRWCLRGDVHWNDVPHPPRARDASGATDYGSVNEWWSEGTTQHIGGEFGQVAIRRASATVSYR